MFKQSSSAFHGTDQQEEPAKIGTKRLVVCGVVLGHCVSSTVRDAKARGYAVDLVADAVLGFDLADCRGGRIAAETVAAVEWAMLGADFARLVQAGQVRFT